ncbi:PREDICTED: ent-copalyl diphosphate synthase, chloroplastic-like [Nelumbo nucifera]|uniref:Ent-copalyl diphosphate synthase, chloroplastic-like n=1 Tax=Nelumbo nucifera TaxID=4432 RepID=A0A1U8BK57_NELNU|nr:PREDICTED: ent-copalyl diphosphate synthase, chloroplastic-like [Nelumbo nucifera]
MPNTTAFLRLLPPVPVSRTYPSSDPGAVLSGVCSFATENKRSGFGLLRSRRNAIPRISAHVYTEILQNGLPTAEWLETLKNDREGEAPKVSISKEIVERVDSIKAMLSSMEDGEISISAYDTAWVSLVQDILGGGAPQFPSSLLWIVDNQLPDGSWGDHRIFSAHDRIISTLACVIALKSWNICPRKCDKGVVFIRENMSRLESENPEHMSIGFEVAFPSLIEIARKLHLQVPVDSTVMQMISAKRNLKLTRIPKEMMHIVPTTLLHSLEGMPGLDWEKLLKLQSPDGSFLFSPSSTAFALMQTKDENCLKYLKRVVERFNGGVPNVYPVDLFEHIWAVDRLERLGISRYFQSEIKECLDYVYRYWTEDGICWARNSTVHDIDDTAMAFRLLRLHGHDVSPDAFRHFEKGGEFFCFAGQSNQAITGMFNLYRASQVLFPGEKILEEAKTFSSRFLSEKQASNQLLDKWIITKDLPGEVRYALDIPWYASLPRLEARYYLEQYGGEDDVWIGKTLYRMPLVNNNVYLELAKLDFNNCQALHQHEWVNLQKWYTDCNLGEFGVNRGTLLQAYYVAAASIFEPERWTERLAWARTAVLVEAVSLYLEKEDPQRGAFVHDFFSNIGGSSIFSSDNKNKLDKRRWGSKRTAERLVEALLGTLNRLSLDSLLAHGQDVLLHLRRAWATWLLISLDEAEEEEEEEDKQQTGREAELLVRTINLCAGRPLSEELLCHPHYRRLVQLTNRVCHHLRRFREWKVNERSSDDPNTSSITTCEIESDMQELVQCVLRSSDGIDPAIKQTFLAVAKSYYYTAHCPPAMINLHIAKVLFESVH